jgi:hypothetical protein
MPTNLIFGYFLAISLRKSPLPQPMSAIKGPLPIFAFIGFGNVRGLI